MRASHEHRHARPRRPYGKRLMDRDTQKRAAAEAAAAMIEDGMVVGLGTGSTARFAIEALIRRVRDGLRIRAIPTSERSAAQARDGGIPLTSFTDAPPARHHDRRRRRDRERLAEPDQGSRRRAAAREDRRGGIGSAGHRRRRQKAGGPAGRHRAGAGGGGAVRLGDDGGSPAPARHRTTAQARCGRQTVLHRRRQSHPRLPVRRDRRSRALDLAIGQTVGVVETGLFIGMAKLALVADDSGVRRLTIG